MYRPGGAALNAGQVGGFRAAALIGNRYAAWTLDPNQLAAAAREGCEALLRWISQCARAERSWQHERSEFQMRMSRAGAHVRSLPVLRGAVADAWTQWRRLETEGCRYDQPCELREALRNRQLCFAHAVYLQAIVYQLESGVGSRGSALVLDRNGLQAHETLGPEWRFAQEDPAFREKVLQTEVTPDGTVVNQWVSRRPIPETDAWFETAWAAFQRGEIYAG